MNGRIQSIRAENTESFIETFDTFMEQDLQNKIFISRYPQSILMDLVDISEIDCYWLTTTQHSGTIDPSLEKINHFVESNIQQNNGHIYMEGIEWMVSLHGFEAVHSMIRTLAEKVSLSDWMIYISISVGSFETRDLSRLYREAPLLEISNPNLMVNEDPKDKPLIEPQASNGIEMDLNDDGTPKLIFLSRLPRSGFSKQILQRRILQWRRMGLDTSDIESSLYSDDIDKIYSDYRIIEEKVRRATELERHIIQNISDSQERAVSMFRVRQLTGLDELERQYFSD